ncbi:MAG: bifunctional aspartate kinase/homoserine dehydrogenase I [bacterium]
MKVLKFGGSSVSSPDRIRDVTRIVRSVARKERVLVVVSAFQGITNQLLECARLAEQGNNHYQDLYQEIVTRHAEAVEQLVQKKSRKQVHVIVDGLLHELQDILHGSFLLRYCPPRTLDLIASFGERLSATIIAAHLRHYQPACVADARQLIVTDDHFTHAAVMFEETNVKIRSFFKKLFASAGRTTTPIITGFIASTEDGRTTTIGRNGSDYTAAIIGAALNVSMIEIWTDVDGILSADPRTVPSAFVLPHLSYEEAMELSFFGAKVLHSATIAPAVARRIPILIKNTMNPTAPGTLITAEAKEWKGVAKGITSVDHICLLTLRGMSMAGVPGRAERLFRALGSQSINALLIAQASSEHTLCFAVPQAQAPLARKAVLHEFQYELHNQLTSLDERHDQSIIAIVGEGMKQTPGVSGKVFQALGQNNINITAIAQGATERNISFVISAKERNRALNVIHEAFFEQRKSLAVVLVGVGNIGSTFLRQLHQQHQYLREHGYNVRVCGIANSKRFVLSPDGIDLTSWREELDQAPRYSDHREITRRVAQLGLTNAALIDCTASSAVVDSYADYVKANLHIITPNKRANVLPWDRYSSLMDLLKTRQKYFLYEANVGAGLPIISTMNDLIASGDEIVKVEGMFSGTLSYLFNMFDGTRPFSVFLQQAHQLGFTEPDPREDLSGDDVARKLLILARQLGLKMEMEDIEVENLVPELLRKGKFSKSFFTCLAQYDAVIQKRLEQARVRGAVLRYVGTFQGKKAFAGLREVPLNHPLASTKGSDNSIAFTTHRYARTPLVVQGPGAGADVTAMGVFSDLLKLLHYLPF